MMNLLAAAGISARVVRHWVRVQVPFSDMMIEASKRQVEEN
jgi:hypothetical protein